MLTRVDEEAHLRRADDHLRLAVFLLSAQEERVARQKAAGLDIQLSEEILSTMQAILRSFIVHRQAILDALDNERRSRAQR